MSGFIESAQVFFERLSVFQMSNIHASLLLMLFSITGVFAVLLIFFLVLRLLQKVFPPKN